MAASHDAGRGPSASERSPLPFMGRVAPFDGGWAVSIPVRAEHCELEKQRVEYERVTVHLDRRVDVERVSARVRREALTIESEERARHDRPTVRIREAPYLDEITDRA